MAIETKQLHALSKIYREHVADHLKTEDAKYGYDKDGKSLNPKDKKKKLKKEGFSNWRHDLKEIPDYEQIP